jgi:predicted ATP-dependent serine protease
MTRTNGHSLPCRLSIDPIDLTATQQAQSLLSVATAEPESVPLSSEMRWLTNAVGRLVRAGIYLLAGQPGSRKSGLALQMCLDLARQNHKCLIILNEEPASRLKERAIQMSSRWAPSTFRRALGNLHIESNLYDLELLKK